MSYASGGVDDDTQRELFSGQNAAGEDQGYTPMPCKSAKAGGQCVPSSKRKAGSNPARWHQEKRMNETSITCSTGYCRCAEKDQRIAELESQLAQVTRERDEARAVLVAQIKAMGTLLDAVPELIESVGRIKLGEPVPFAHGLFDVVPKLNRVMKSYAAIDAVKEG